MEEHNESRVYEKDALEFVTVAAEYCNLLDTVGGLDRKQFFSTMQQLLSLLYLKAFQIKNVEPMLDSTVEKLLSEQEWIKLKNKVSAKLGNFDIFVEVEEPDSQVEDEEVSVSLSECFTDIYQDLSDFVYLFRNGSVEIMNDALWECQNNFQQYWGSRLLIIMAAFHNIIYNTEDVGSNEFDSKPGEDTTGKNPYIW
ncbi:MAG: DUF5063 domain-containing protein [Bacteroidota bacterium]|nr:DUF5063 domain-containing protein [Bacteroidota bacterium]